MHNNPDLYSYRVFGSPEDEEFVGACSEFPSLSRLASTQAAALAGIQDLVAAVVTDIRHEGGVVAEPLTSRAYSGQVHVRLPPNLHRGLALEAEETGRSLNRVLIDRLVSNAGSAAAPPKRIGRPPAKKAAAKAPRPRASASGRRA